jgi:hypothetical protein
VAKKSVAESVTLVTFDERKRGAWRFWWLGIALLSLAGWAGIALVLAAIRHLLT